MLAVRLWYHEFEWKRKTISHVNGVCCSDVSDGIVSGGRYVCECAFDEWDWMRI